MIWLVLAEAALEPVPEALLGHPSVLADVKRKGTPPGPKRPRGCQGWMVRMVRLISARPAGVLNRATNCSGE